jgi:hypothetical protein
VSVDDLIRAEPARLVWNPTEHSYWFHYTTPTVAEKVYETGVYIVGQRSRPGLYVTTAQPGSLSEQQLLNRLFDGTRDVERTKGALVLLRDDSGFPLKRDSEYGWMRPATPGDEIDLRPHAVGWCAVVDGEWAFHRGLYVPANSRA